METEGLAKDVTLEGRLEGSKRMRLAPVLEETGRRKARAKALWVGEDRGWMELLG